MADKKKSTTKPKAAQLDEKDLDKVAGGFAPQPEPPKTSPISNISQSAIIKR